MLALTPAILANGGSSQKGIVEVGNVMPGKARVSTNVALEEEDLEIVLRDRTAHVDVRYRMTNTGAATTQPFFFPVESWSGPLEYTITADGEALEAADIEGPAIHGPRILDGEVDPSARSKRWWKQSSIPFAAGQSREVRIRFVADYYEEVSAVSDDFVTNGKAFQYAVSPAATWKGSIRKGRVQVRVETVRPEDCVIERPAGRFQPTASNVFEWKFTALKPTLADDIRIRVTPAERGYGGGYSPDEDHSMSRQYRIIGKRYFLDHADFVATASTSQDPDSGAKSDVTTLGGRTEEQLWVAGGDKGGVGEWVRFETTRLLPLDAILVRGGFGENPEEWRRFPRLASLHVVLNDEFEFDVKLPDSTYDERWPDFPIVVRGYTKPVRTVKLVVTGIHPGSAPLNACISSVRFSAKLAKMPKIRPAR